MYLGTDKIRIFSYYPYENINEDDYRMRVIERTIKKIEYLGPYNIVLVHENECGIYGATAQRCVDLVEAVNSYKLRLAYDPANFVCCGIKDNIETCWPLMKEYVWHVHIKDWKLGQEIASIPGQGDGQIKELLEELAKMKYEGFLTMEPHLNVAGRFRGSTKIELYSQSIAEVRKLAQQAGLKLA